MSDGAVRFLERVVSLYTVTVAMLVMFLVVPGVRVLYLVLELVLRMSLEVKTVISVWFSNLVQ